MPDTDAELQTADIVIVGGGGSGLAAAVSASARGMRIVVLEKANVLGGTTRYSVGSVSAACTRLQRRANITDNADDFRADMRGFIPEFVTRDNPRLRSVLAVESGITVQWLEDLGVVFAGPFPEPPNRVSGMHNVVPASRMYISKLASAARRAGVTIRLQASAQKLVTDASGTVVGIEYMHEGNPRQISVRRGVILASGDFSGNKELRKKFLRPAAVAAIPINPVNTGDGHELAKQVGAAWRNMDVLVGPQFRFPRAPKMGFIDLLPDWSWLARLGALYFKFAPSWMIKPLVTSLLIANMSPSERLFHEGAVLVDLDGERLSTVKAADSLAEARDATGYIILDERLARLFMKYPYFISTAPGIAYAYFSDYVRGRPDLVRRAASVAELAGRIGLSADRLSASVEDLQSGALYALGPVHAMLTITEGSLAVDEHCRVLKENGQVVEGLYAAGAAGQANMTLKGHGLHLAWALTSGRIAGEMAARRFPNDAEEWITRGEAAKPMAAPDHSSV